MIARAMDPAPAEALLYADLARRGRRVSRSFTADQLPRLASSLVDLLAVDVALAFDRDDSGRCRVSGEVRARSRARCQRCAEVVTAPLRATIDCCVVDSEVEADELAAQGDVVLASAGRLDLAALVEDELLLELPDSLCEREPCERAPGLSYPADADGAAPPEEPNPFAALEVLKTDDPQQTD